MALERNGRFYGQGTVLGDSGAKFFEGSDEEMAYDLAWSNGCPVPRKLVKSVVEGGRGAREIAKRYAQLNFWFGRIKDSLQKAGKTELLNGLTEPQQRNADEPLGIHDEGWVPEELFTNSYGLSTPEGYALARVAVEFIKGNQENIPLAMDIIDECAQQSETLAELLVNMAQQFVDNGADGKATLKEMLSNGKLLEDNAYQAYGRILQAMKEKGVSLYELYCSISPAELSKRRIAQINN